MSKILIEKNAYKGYDVLVYPNPEDRPLFVVWVDKIEFTKDAVQDIRVSYLASGFKWRTDYALQIARDNKSASLAAWFTLENHCGKTFIDANVKLVAGQLYQINSGGRFKSVFMADTTARGNSNKVEEEGFFEYHLYTVPMKVTLENNQTKQISFVQIPAFLIHRILKVRNDKSYIFRVFKSRPLAKSHPDVLIIIDSMEFNKSPGSIGIFSFKELSWGNISTHSLPLSLLWEYLYQRGVKEGYIIGIQPGELKEAGELSPAVEEAKQLVKKIFVNLIKEQEIGSV